MPTDQMENLSAASSRNGEPAHSSDSSSSVLVRRTNATQPTTEHSPSSSRDRGERSSTHKNDHFSPEEAKSCSKANPDGLPRSVPVHSQLHALSPFQLLLRFPDKAQGERFRQHLYDANWHLIRVILIVVAGGCTISHIVTILKMMHKGDTWRAMFVPACNTLVSWLFCVLFCMNWTLEWRRRICSWCCWSMPFYIMPVMVIEILFLECSMGKAKLAVAVYGIYGLVMCDKWLLFQVTYACVLAAATGAVLLTPSYYPDYTTDLAAFSLLVGFTLSSVNGYIWLCNARSWILEDEATKRKRKIVAKPKLSTTDVSKMRNGMMSTIFESSFGGDSLPTDSCPIGHAVHPRA